MHSTSLNRKVKKVSSLLKKYPGVVVAFSGGVDSTVLLKIAVLTHGTRVIAATANSPLIPGEDLRLSRQLAKHLHCHQIIFHFPLLNINSFRNNPQNRCLICKTHMLKKLIEIANQHGYELIEASNASDLKNYRPGIAALKKFGIKSPFIEAGINKNQIRQLARKFKLPNWNRPSNACLATRIPYGRPIQKQVLKRIAQGEAYLKKLKIKQVRVRDHFPSTRIEIEEEQFSIILKNRMRVVRYFKKLGYRFITLDLAGYQTGSFDLKFRK